MDSSYPGSFIALHSLTSHDDQVLLDEVGVEVSEPVCNSCQDTTDKMKSLEQLLAQRDQQVNYNSHVRARLYILAIVRLICLLLAPIMTLIH